MARWAKPKVSLKGTVLAETGTSIVMRANEHPGGPDGRPVLVVAHERVSVSEVASELRALANLLDAQAAGLNVGEGSS